MVKVGIIDSGVTNNAEFLWGQFKKLTNSNAYLLPNTITPSQIDVLGFDALVLSGGPYHVYNDLDDKTKEGNLHEIIETFPGQILGICLGHQSIAAVYGGKVGPLSKEVEGLRKITVTKPHSLFNGMNESFMAMEHHLDTVTSLPPGFECIAECEACVEAMVCEKKKRYSVQFHPEKSGKTGEKFLENFLDLISL